MTKIRNFLVITGLLFISFSCQQEKMLFYPSTLPFDYKFTFSNEFKECFFKVDDKTQLNGLLFHSDSSKGLVFYLHGNAGSIDSWGDIASVYLNNNYDFFILDYRGYGKSQGKISSEKQLYKDIKIVYDSLKSIYSENKIVIIGYSIGTGLAAELASTNSPSALILKAPYYNMADLAHQYIKMLPAFFIRYQFRTDEYIKNVKCPIVVFHGDQDEVIYYGSSVKLQKLFKKGDKLITLVGQPHNGINDNKIYLKEINKILNLPLAN